MTTRRAFIGTLVVGLIAAPVAAEAYQAGEVWQRREVCTRLIDWQGLLGRQPIQGRQILRKLFPWPTLGPESRRNPNVRPW